MTGALGRSGAPADTAASPPRLSFSQFAAAILPQHGEGAMDHSHYSKVFGLALAAAFGLMLALNALALSTTPKADGSVRPPLKAFSAPAS